jgi:hypothetical protein
MIRERRRTAATAPAGQLDLRVEAGRVMCPRRGSTDIEACFMCQDFEGFQDGPVERLICAANRDLDLVLTPFAPLRR